MLFLHKRNLLKRDYPRSLINETMKKVKFSMREDKMKPKCNTIKPRWNLHLSPDIYSSRAGRVFRIVQKHWTSMHSDQYDIQKYISRRPMLTYRSNSSLAKMLVRAKLKRPQHRKINKNGSNTRVVRCCRKMSELF